MVPFKYTLAQEWERSPRAPEGMRVRVRVRVRSRGRNLPTEAPVRRDGRVGRWTVGPGFQGQVVRYELVKKQTCERERETSSSSSSSCRMYKSTFSHTGCCELVSNWCSLVRWVYSKRERETMARNEMTEGGHGQMAKDIYMGKMERHTRPRRRWVCERLGPETWSPLGT